MINFSSFSSEFQKLAASAAQSFLSSEKKDWKAFERNLGNPSFQSEIVKGTEDKKLKKYTKAVGGYLQSKDMVQKTPSRSSNTPHQIKRLPTGRLACDCKDWQYKHSWKGTDCDHIRALKKSGIQKLSNAILKPVMKGVYQGMSGARTVDKAQKNYQTGLAVKRLQNAQG